MKFKEFSLVIVITKEKGIKMIYYQKMTPEGYKEIEEEIARLKKIVLEELRFYKKRGQWEIYRKILNILKLREI